MKVLIEIDEEDLERIKARIGKSSSDYIILNGMPLPKGYGRLVDADALVKKMEEREKELKDDKSMWETACVETALDMFAPTIIEADKENEE